MNQDNKNKGEKESTQVFFPGTPKIIQWTIKYSGGLVKDEKQASYVLVGLVALMIIISLFLVFGGGGTQETLPEDFMNHPEFLP